MNIKILWGKSAGYCALCKVRIIESTDAGGDYPIGEAAHIFGEKEGSARYSEAESDDFVGSLNNHILLCPTCHTKIDKNEDDYTVDLLAEERDKHYKWVLTQLSEQVSEVNFPELTVVLDFLMQNNGEVAGEEDLSLVAIRNKIEKNYFSSDVESWIKLGLTKANMVKDYLNQHPDIYFENRFRSKFVEEYNEIKKAGEHGDAAFYSLISKSTPDDNGLKGVAAATTVVTYFFERCDIFEK